MRTVEDREGGKHLLLKHSASTSLVQNLQTGERTYVPTDDLRPVEADPLRVAGRALEDEIRTEIPDERTAGLFRLLDNGMTSVRTLLEQTDLCESELFGMLRELEAAGVVEREETREDATYTVTTDAIRRGADQS